MKPRTYFLLGLIITAMLAEQIYSRAPARVQVAQILSRYPWAFLLPWLWWKLPQSQRLSSTTALLLLGSALSLAGSVWAIAKIEFTWHQYLATLVGVAIEAVIFGGLALLGELVIGRVKEGRSGADSPDQEASADGDDWHSDDPRDLDGRTSTHL